VPSADRSGCAIARNPCHPGWFNPALFVDDFLHGYYEGALQQTSKSGFDVGFWGALLRAVVLAKIGRAADARDAAEALLVMIPDFEQRAADLMRRPILSETIVEALLDGLGAAGVRVARSN
jgi:hypothetical protein